MKVRDVRSDRGEIQAVLALLKQAKDTVGFLPDQAVIDRVAQGTLLVAVDEADTIVGYLLYDLPGIVVTIRQLVVSRDARGHGAARALVDVLVERYGSSRQGIGLTCRRDFDATLVWEHLDFTPRSERPGRGKVPRELTFWWRSFNQPNLFSLALEADRRPIAAIDTQLVIWGADGRVEVVDQLLADWVTEDVRVAIAPHTLVELNRQENRELRAANVGYARRFEELRVDPPTANAMEAIVTTAIGPTRAAPHRNDIKLAAQAAAGGARWFVSNDRPFRTACADALRSIAGIQVLSASDMLLAADRLLRGETYRPHDLLGTDITVRAVDHGETDALARTFVNQRAGEALKPWRLRLEQLIARVEETQVFVFCDGTAPIGLVAIRAGDVIEVPICRVSRGGPEQTLARQVLGWLRHWCIEHGHTAVKVTDPAPGPSFDRAFVAEGYLPQPTPVAVPMRGQGTIGDVVTLLRSLPLRDHVDPRHANGLEKLPSLPVAAKSVEAVFHPFMVSGAGLKTVRVPIHPGYAVQLFDHSLSEGQLFPRKRSVALAREQVYFRKPTAPALFQDPTRILWQVTGQAYAGGGTIRGWSILNDCVVGNVDQLAARFSHLGVLHIDEISEYSTDGLVMALRFSHTHVFASPVTLGQYREVMSLLEPGKGLSHAGPQPVTERVFARLRTMGS